MNKNETMGTANNERPVYRNEEIQEALKPSPLAEQAGNEAVLHEAKIITPQPYGVFALCKIVEHLQIN